jgi:hypothetical protein
VLWEGPEEPPRPVVVERLNAAAEARRAEARAGGGGARRGPWW